MAIVRCKLGYAETQIANTTYRFDRDRHGRFVCEVGDLRHVQILVSAGTYEIVEAEPSGPVAEPGPSALERLTAEFEASVAPQILAVPHAEEKRYFVVAPWPELTSLPLSEIEKGMPQCVTIDPNDRLIIGVQNGAARYALKGTLDVDHVGRVRIYALEPGSTIDLSVPVPDERGVVGSTPSGDAGAQATASTPAVDIRPNGLIDIKGVGAAMVARLAEAGVDSLSQLAALSEEDAKKLDATVKANGAIARDHWIEQAKALLNPAA